MTRMTAWVLILGALAAGAAAAPAPRTSTTTDRAAPAVAGEDSAAFVRSLVKAGRYVDAAAAARRLVAREQSSGDPMRVAGALDLLAESLWRGGKSQPVTVTLGDLASDDASKATPSQNDDKGSQSSSEKVLSSLGLTVSPADDGNGLAITDVDPDSDAAARGLKTGEKITSVNNQQVASAADIEKILEQAKKDGRSKALFQIQTDDGSRFIALDIDQG